MPSWTFALALLLRQVTRYTPDVAKQRIPNDQREAVWEAHGRKCFHCPKTLTLGQAEIDHLVPEYSSARLIGSLKKQGALPAAFNLLGPENWVPACRGCNGAKGSIVYSPTLLAGRVKAIERRLPRFHEVVEAKKRDKSVDQIVRDAMRGIGRGQFTKSELIKALVGVSSAQAPPANASIKPRPSADRRTIQFSVRAISDLTNEHLSLGDLAETVRTATESGAIKALADLTRADRFVLRIGRNVRLVFSVTRGAVVLERVDFR